MYIPPPLTRLYEFSITESNIEKSSIDYFAFKYINPPKELEEIFKEEKVFFDLQLIIFTFELSYTSI